MTVPDRCLDCNDRPKLVDVYSETFAVRAPSGAALHLTLRLCLRCGSRFPDRSQLRDYLRTRLPDYAVQWALATSRHC
jgi:hypothetical protein